MLSRAAQSTSVRSQRIKIAVTITAFVVAGIIIAANLRSSSPIEANDRRPVDFLCTRCAHHFSVGFEIFAQVAGAVNDVGNKPQSGTGRRRSVQEQAVTMACPSCGQHAGKPAVYCPRHALYYSKHTSKGGNARCPKCNPPPETAP